MSFVSCVHPLKPPTKNRIRGETHIAGYIIKPSATKPGSTDLCVLTQCDIKVNFLLEVKRLNNSIGKSTKSNSKYGSIKSTS